MWQGRENRSALPTLSDKSWTETGTSRHYLQIPRLLRHTEKEGKTFQKLLFLTWSEKPQAWRWKTSLNKHVKLLSKWKLNCFLPIAERMERAKEGGTEAKLGITRSFWITSLQTHWNMSRINLCMFLPELQETAVWVRTTDCLRKSQFLLFKLIPSIYMS